MKRFFGCLAVAFCCSCSPPPPDIEYARSDIVESWPLFVRPGYEDCFVNVRWDKSEADDASILAWAKQEKGRKDAALSPASALIALDFVSGDLLFQLLEGGGETCRIVDQNALDTFTVTSFPAETFISKASVIPADNNTRVDDYVDCSFSIYLTDRSFIPGKRPLWKSDKVLIAFRDWNLGATYIEGESSSDSLLEALLDNQDKAHIATNRNCHLSEHIHATAFAEMLKLFGINSRPIGLTAAD